MGGHSGSRSNNPRRTETSRQAGDEFVTFVLEQLEIARKSIPAITSAAELAADRIVYRAGELLSAGDDAFATGCTWRAGGICFSKRYDLEKPIDTSMGGKPSGGEQPYYRTADFDTHFVVRDATPNDVVLLGYEDERKEQLRVYPYVQQLLAGGPLIILFGPESTARQVRGQFGERDNLTYITHNVPDGGIVQIPGWPDKVCSGRSFVERLYLWVFEAELLGAFLRRGKMPGILLSVTYESPQIFNHPLINYYRFIPSFNTTPVDKGIFGQTYLDHLQQILGGIIPGQRENLLRATQWLAEAVQSGNKIYALLIHHVTSSGQPGDPNLFTVYTEGNAYYPELANMKPGDVAVHVGYNWYPTDLVNLVDKAGGKLILCTTLVQDLPPRPVVYGEGGPVLHFTSADQVPKRDNHVFIDIKFSQYDATLKVPGYPVLAIPTSDFANNMVYWMFVANTAELLGRK